MKVIACLNWYEEPASWLADAVASVSRLASHVIAVDGPYAAFPGAIRKPQSSPEQVETIAHTASGLGMGLTLHVPSEPWWGNEVEKRDFMHRLACSVAEEGDWLFVIDADEAVSGCPPEVMRELAETDLDVAEVRLWERPGGEHMLRRLYRVLPEMRVEQTHYTVTARKADRKVFLSGNASAGHILEPVLPLWDLRLEHRTQYRDAGRKAAKQQYNVLVAPMEMAALEGANA